MNYRSSLGKQAENLVADYLKKEGFTILAQNFRQLQGEIDLIALKKDLLVFVEVKMRQKSSFDLSEVITRGKQRKIIYTAKKYILLKGFEHLYARFDVALVEGASKMSYISNAFNESDCTW